MSHHILSFSECIFYFYKIFIFIHYPTSPRQIHLFRFVLLILEGIDRIYSTLTLPPYRLLHDFQIRDIRLLFGKSTYLFFYLSISNITPLSSYYILGLVTYKPFVTQVLKSSLDFELHKSWPLLLLQSWPN